MITPQRSSRLGVRELPIASCFLPPFLLSSASAAAPWPLVEWRGARRLVLVAAGVVLADDDDVAFFQIAADLRDTAIGQACAHEARLDLLVADQHPNHLSLSPLTVATCAGARLITLTLRRLSLAVTRLARLLILRVGLLILSRRPLTPGP